MDEVDVAAQAELGHEEPEVVLAGDEIGRGRHMHQHVDVRGVDPGVGERGTPRSQRQITVVEAAVGSAQLAPSAEVVVQPALTNAEVLDDPLGLERPAVRTNRAQVLQDLLVGDPPLRQVGADALQRHRDIGPHPGYR